MMQKQEDSGFIESVLPWIITAAALMVYGLTLNHWVTIASLSTVAKVTGWDWWTPTLQAPLLYLLSYPLRLLPAAWQPAAMNMLGAACAAGALGLLAQSVTLLPHDRTRDQRQRERSDYSLLSIPSAWIPPVLAVTALGLQLTFWEHATAITGESLNLLLFAYVVRSVLQYRLDQRESQLTRMAFVYGLAVTNNWAMIGFFPVMLMTLVWIKGKLFFEGRFLCRMLAWGMAGLLPYLVLPLIETAFGASSMSFWQALKAQWGFQKYFLVAVPKSRVLLCSLTSLLPLLVMGIRWPSSLGDTSVLGGMVTNLAFRVVHGLFLAVCIWLVFDPPFSPRALGFGLPFLTFYYLAALSIGYFSGYFLLVFGTDPEKAHRHRSSTVRLANRAIAGLVWLALIAVPAGLVMRNGPLIADRNNSPLDKFSQTLTKSLPDRGAIVLSDEPITLLLVEATLSRRGTAQPHILIDTRSLANPGYHRQLLRRYPQRWPDFFANQKAGAPVDGTRVMGWLIALSLTNEIYYLHPGFNYLHEGFYERQRGLACQMTLYPPETVNPPPLTLSEIATNQAFWAKIQPDLAELKRPDDAEEKDSAISDRDYVARFYSRAANCWGVELERNGTAFGGKGGKGDGRPFFEVARRLNPGNVAALVNLKRLGSFSPSVGDQLDQKIQQLRRRYLNWDMLLRDNGGFDDPVYCGLVGQFFAENLLFRQAAQQFLRVKELDPDNFEAYTWLADLYLRGQWPDQSLKEIQAARAAWARKPLNSTNQVELVRLESWCYLAKTNFDKAIQVLQAAQQQYPQDPSLPKTLYDMFLMAKQFSNALAAIDQQLLLEPNNPRSLLNKGALCIQVQAYDQALPLLDRVVQLQPRNEAARMNRAIARLQSGKLDAAQEDYESLLRLVPHMFQAYYGLAEIAYQRQEIPKAIKNYRLFLRYAPPDTKEIQPVSERLKSLESGSSRR